MNRNIFFSFALVIILFVIFIWWRANQGALPAAITFLYNFPHGDKVGHFLLMGALTFFVCLPFSFGEQRHATKRIIIIIAIISIIITLEEISQHFFSSRSMDVVDLLCSYTGILVFGGLVWLIASKRKNARAQ